VELGFPSVGDPLIPPGQGCLINKHLRIVQSRFGPKILFWCMNFESLKVELGFPSMGPLNSTGAWLFNHQTSKISLNSFWRNISLWVF
jgi:hypothetical protein